MDPKWHKMEAKWRFQNGRQVVVPMETQNDPKSQKMGPKSHKMDPKWTQNGGPNEDPKSPKMDPKPHKMDPKWRFQNGCQVVVPMETQNDPK